MTLRILFCKICLQTDKVKVKVAQSCPTLCDPMDYAVHGILQARILEWVAFPSPGDLPNPGIEPRQSNLPHCRWILHQLSYEGSPTLTAPSFFSQFSLLRKGIDTDMAVNSNHALKNV